MTQETKINRSVTYRVDYGEMSVKDRYKLISGDKFHIDKDFLEGKQLLFLDKVKITGTHERNIIKMLNDAGIKNDCYMLYFAELVQLDISPRFENFLNNHFVTGINDIDAIIGDEDFVLNTHVVKYILKRDERDFGKFIKNKSLLFCVDLYDLAVRNEYYQFDSYTRNLENLKHYVSLCQTDMLKQN